jgi:aminoglycoside phosphotransferase (APT) family kinase protein
METKLLALAARLWPDASGVDGLERLSGGANNETWSFDALTGAGRVPLILRRKTDTGAAPMPGREGRTLAPETEAALIGAAGRGGVRVPAVQAVLAPGDGLGRGFLMARVSGETRPKRLLRDAAFADARRTALVDAAAALAALHALPIDAVPGLRRSDAEGELAMWAARLRHHRAARPVFELALRWLQSHRPPPPERPAPVHGDFRTGNLLFDRQGLRAVLDWELAHAGDPMEDLGWFCVASWRFGELDAHAGGFGRRDAWIEAYRAAGGRADPDRVRYWEVLGTFRWGVMCLDMGETWRSGRDRSVERVAVARRASEAELDLLRLLAPRG